MMRFRHRARTWRTSLIWALVALLLASSVLGAIAKVHPPIHDEALGAFAAVAEAHPSECDDETPQASGWASLSHDLAHTWNHCGVVMAVLPTPIIKLLALPPTHPASAGYRATPAPALQGLFRPPIR